MSGPTKRKRPTLAEVRHLEAEVRDLADKVDRLRRDNLALIERRSLVERQHDAVVRERDEVRRALREIRHALGVEDGYEYSFALDEARRLKAEADKRAADLTLSDGRRDDLVRLHAALGVYTTEDTLTAIMDLRLARDQAEGLLSGALEDLAAARNLRDHEHALAEQARAKLRVAEGERDYALKRVSQLDAQRERLLVGLRTAEGAIRLAMTDGNEEVVS